MAENIEFIPANELPEANGDEVSVLCLENGELKQKPGASLGGGGGNTPLCRTYTSEDIVLGAGGSEQFIVDSEIVTAVMQSINNKTPMPQICFVENTTGYVPQKLDFGFGMDVNTRGFGFPVQSNKIYVFDTYENAFDYYDR